MFEESRFLVSEVPLSGLGAYRTRSVEIWSTGYLFGYGYCLPPYGAAYRSTLRTTRTQPRTRGASRGYPLCHFLGVELKFQGLG